MRCYRPITITDPGRELQMGDPSLRSGGGAGEAGGAGGAGGAGDPSLRSGGGSRGGK